MGRRYDMPGGCLVIVGVVFGAIISSVGYGFGSIVMMQVGYSVSGISLFCGLIYLMAIN